ncbi:MAG TPA: M3 family metallopeptidase [Usitatibacter sp.]|nr:M3 family metallopeptidase [Usitatibacter sp.]
MRYSILCFALAATAFAAHGQGTARPLIPLLDAPAIARSCEEGLARARAMISAMEAKPPEGFFADWNALQVAIEDTLNPIWTMGTLSPDKAVRDAAEPCLTQYTALSTELFQNEKLFARVSAATPASAAETKLRRNLVEGFEDSGVALPAEKRERAREIFARLEKLRQDFERRLREDATRVVFSPAEVAGLPERFLQRQKREGESYVLGLDDATYMQFMSNARSEAARKRFYFARFSKGGQANLDTLEEAFKLRRELANLYGLPTYAHYATRRKMAGSPDNVNRFLGEVKRAVEEVEKKELEELAAMKAKETAQPSARISRWDTAYYSERMRRERFAVDQESLRKYFPPQKAVEYALRVAETLYGVRFKEEKVPVWVPDVRYYDVLDGASGKYLAGIYLDLFPRDGKRSGAWAGSVRRGSRLAGRTPLSTLATNFNREGLGPREMETLFHEFGHVLHNVLSQTDYVSQSGTAVKRDFVEAPSQMFEEWVRREQPLALMKQVCPECPQLTREQIERLDGARRFGMGIRYAGQWLLASFDMALSTEPRPPQQVWKELESATRLGHVEVLRPASFSHIAGPGYAAGYYGYMWSEVLALDMLTPFERDMLDPKVGARYREAILSAGGSAEETTLVKNFLGREPSSEAFFKEITGKR